MPVCIGQTPTYSLYDGMDNTITNIAGGAVDGVSDLELARPSPEQSAHIFHSQRMKQYSNTKIILLYICL
jgi:hypothetical protein